MALKRARIGIGRWTTDLVLLSALVGLAWFSGAAGGGVAEAQQAATNPHGDIKIPCADCHTTSSWQELRDPLPFEHKESGFPLVEGHGDAACGACHESLVFEYVATACADCHSDPHRAELGFGCETCHSPAGWQDRRNMFVFHFTTLFPLLGGHATLDCDSCHHAAPPFEYTNTPTDCVSCHAADFANTVDPDHAALGFPTDCELCHDVDNWQAGTIGDHHDLFFPLLGAHEKLNCSACHTDGFANTPTDCYSCHTADYDNTTNPDHAAAGFPTDCELCHNEVRWNDATFDHSTFFVLKGAHKKLDCTDCHSDGFAGTPTDCYSCHTSDYDNTTNPNHAAAGFPTDCELCHSEVRWDGATFDHSIFFPLNGAHKKLDCTDCHSSGFADTPTDCFSCHTSDYNNTKNPNHADAGFPTDCELCHNERRWEGAKFDHDTFFVLKGKHRKLDCQECHATGYAGTPTDCYSCHTSDYDNTTDPNHTAAGFPTDCELCHTEVRWDGATFDHSTFFVLKGAHRKLDCADCHADGFAGTPTDCFSCHTADYNNTTNPNHKAAGFPTDCEVCHTENKWEGATFDHSTFYTLTGAHRNLDCAACHASGFAGTPTDCFSCHQSDYNNTTDPNHAAAGFPTNCELCHNTSNWDDADFGDHDALYFPIFSGKHNNEWDTCADCHTQASTFASFECTTCHEHRQSEMDNKHKNVNGYQYVSALCLQCHPNGTEDGGGGDRRGQWWHP